MKNKLDLEKYRKTGKFILSSGKESDHYYDVKEAMGEPSNLQKMFAVIMQSVPLEVDVFIGLAYGGIPLAVISSIMTGKPFAVLRKEEKKWGTKKLIEGWQKKGKAVLLDDVQTTGDSLDKAELYLNSQGYDVIAKIPIMVRKD